MQADNLTEEQKKVLRDYKRAITEISRPTKAITSHKAKLLLNMTYGRSRALEQAK